MFPSCASVCPPAGQASQASVQAVVSLQQQRQLSFFRASLCAPASQASQASMQAAVSLQQQRHSVFCASLWQPGRPASRSFSETARSLRRMAIDVSEVPSPQHCAGADATMSQVAPLPPLQRLRLQSWRSTPLARSSTPRFAGRHSARSGAGYARILICKILSYTSPVELLARKFAYAAE